jgi:hypothetical protein
MNHCLCAAPLTPSRRTLAQDTVLVLALDEEPSVRPGLPGLRSPPWSPTREFTLGPLTPTRSSRHPWQPSPSSSTSPSPQLSDGVRR